MSAVHIVAAVPSELGDLPGSPLGVGPVAAAVAAASLLMSRPGAPLVLIGTAGSFAGGPPPGSVITTARLGFADPTATLGLGYVPLAPPPLHVEALPGFPAFDVLTRLGVTTDAALAARLAAEGPWHVEHMEAYAVAWACHQAGVRFSALLGITNWVGPEAHLEWKERHVEVEEHVRRALTVALAPRVTNG